MELIPYRNFGEQDHKTMISLIDPDDAGPWAIRYLWIQHTQDNDSFYENYFTGGNSVGFNVRKQTTDLKQHWNPHNQIFYDSAANGDLVYRIKIGNQFSRSIDYIEVWRGIDVLEKYFGNRDATIQNMDWKRDERKKFAEVLFERGFDIRSWYPYIQISKSSAAEHYKKYVDRWKNKENCIINTPWNRDLNPL